MNDLLKAAMSAVYAGHKWRLSMEDNLSQMEKGEVCTNKSAALTETYYQMLFAYVDQCLEIHRELQDTGKDPLKGE